MRLLLGIILILCVGCNKTSPIEPEVPPWHPDHPINGQPHDIGEPVEDA